MNGSPSYRLCVDDSSANPQPLMAMALPTGVFCGASSCWKNSKSGFGYRNKAATPTDARDGSTECWQTTDAMATVDDSSELGAKGP